MLDEEFEVRFLKYSSRKQGHNRFKSTNTLERLNEEIRRREKVIRIFPHTDSTNRLNGAAFMDIHENWISPPRKHIQF